MSTLKQFNQGDLIKRTGSQFPEGICLGLVIQWLISIKKNNEKQFWRDVEDSLPGPKTPLLGKGYAKEAIKNQDLYNGYYLIDDLSENYVVSKLSEGGLQAISQVEETTFLGISSVQIAKFLLESDHRYSQLGIAHNDSWNHAIGCFRNYSMLGKSTTVDIFDPNIGKFTCKGKPDLEATIEQIRGQAIPMYGSKIDTYELIFYG